MKKYHSNSNKKYPRDMVGYGSKKIEVKWPNNAKIALQIVLNYEEGAENCVLHGDKSSEIFLSDIFKIFLQRTLKEFPCAEINIFLLDKSSGFIFFS